MEKPFDLTFSVGPTQISQDVKNDIIYASHNNLLSVSHRGQEFTNISKNTIQNLRKLYNIPEDYEIFFTSSATESWELCARNVVQKEAFAFTCGHFSDAFSKCLEAWGKVCHQNGVSWGEINKYHTVKIPKTAEMVALCHNETSTGVTCSLDDIRYLHKTYPDKILAVDVTSSIGACALNIEDADIWYFSVQKGFGLPSGLGVMFVNSKAIEKSKKLLAQNHNQGFFSFTNMQKQMGHGKFQTISTPNILGIYLLGKQCERLLEKDIKKIDKNTKNRAEDIYAFFEDHPDTRPFIEDKKCRSPFSLCIYVGAEKLKIYKNIANQQGVELGGGYGHMKTDYIRISNYPTITDSNIETLKKIFKA